MNTEPKMTNLIDLQKHLIKLAGLQDRTVLKTKVIWEGDRVTLKVKTTTYDIHKKSEVVEWHNFNVTEEDNAKG